MTEKMFAYSPIPGGEADTIDDPVKDVSKNLFFKNFCSKNNDSKKKKTYTNLNYHSNLIYHFHCHLPRHRIFQT